MTLVVFPNQIFGISPDVVKTPESRTLTPESPAGIGPRIAQTRNPIWNFQLIYEYLSNNASSIPSTPGNPNYTKSELETMMGMLLANLGQAGEFLLEDPEDNGLDYLANPLTQTLQLVEDTSQPISAVAVGSGGSGFNVNDLLAVLGGGGTGAILKVTSVSGGAITGLAITDGGLGYTTTSGAALQPITGSGAGSPTANITATPIWYSPIQRTIGDPSVAQFQEDITDLNPQDYSGLQVWANGTLQTAGTNFNVAGPGLAFPGYSFMGLYLQWLGGSAPATPITAQFKWYFRVRFAQDKTDFERFLYRLWTIGGSNQQRGGGVLKLKTARPVLA